MMGCAVDNLDMEKPWAWSKVSSRSGKPHQHVVINVDKIVKASRDPALRQIINDCDLINADGMPVVWASRLLGKPLKERVTGVRSVRALMARAAEKGWRSICSAPARWWSAASPAVSGPLSGADPGRLPKRLLEARDEDQVVAEIAATRADILFVAISSPKKEAFLARYQAAMKMPFAMGVGGTFDVAVGLVKRAPVWMQNAGLEWFYRFLQEPRRMFRRYFIDDMAFVALFARADGSSAEQEPQWVSKIGATAGSSVIWMRRPGSRRRSDASMA